MPAHILVLAWGDGDYEFKLRIREVVELERLTDSTIGEIFQRVTAGRYKITDIVETIRLGLIGGGLAPVRAKQLIDLYVDGQPIVGAGDPSSPYMTAVAVLQNLVVGLQEASEDAGK